MIPAVLVRCNKSPILAKLIVQDAEFHIVEVTCKGGPRYALGSKQRAGGYRWAIAPTTKSELWTKMKEVWDITIK